MGKFVNGKWHSDTGCDTPVIAFDCDGTLNSKGEGQIGVENGAQWDLTPVKAALALGCRVAVMTCNVPEFVAGKLRDHGIAAYADDRREYKVPPFTDGTVLVTDRKVLADFYVDDRNVHFAFGDSVPALFAAMGLDRDGDGRLDGYDDDGPTTPEYQLYVKAQAALWAGTGDPAAVAVAMDAAVAAAQRWVPGSDDMHHRYQRAMNGG